MRGALRVSKNKAIHVCMSLMRDIERSITEEDEDEEEEPEEEAEEVAVGVNGEAVEQEVVAVKKSCKKKVKTGTVFFFFFLSVFVLLKPTCAYLLQVALPLKKSDRLEPLSDDFKYAFKIGMMVLKRLMEKKNLNTMQKVLNRRKIRFLMKPNFPYTSV